MAPLFLVSPEHSTCEGTRNVQLARLYEDSEQRNLDCVSLRLLKLLCRASSVADMAYVDGKSSSLLGSSLLIKLSYDWSEDGIVSLSGNVTCRRRNTIPPTMCFQINVKLSEPSTGGLMGSEYCYPSETCLMVISNMFHIQNMIL